MHVDRELGFAMVHAGLAPKWTLRLAEARAREVEEAQGALVRLAKSLADRGGIVIGDPNSDEAMII